ncbi:MAG: bacteriohemerythrin [Burkholderiaceae bacterium]|nr:bacteriohemerythrin [Burkholderiaceae bacterium]
MTHFVWTNNLNTGQPFIDEDHRKLVSMINTFHEFIEQGKGRDVTGKVLDNLITYYNVHFAREEMEMQRISYPLLEEHKQEHAGFIEEVTMLKKNFDSGATVNPVNVAHLLNDWLRNHIVKVDTKLAAALKAAK